jgi:spore coat polysaccharide biosynthesis protein SpsF (cytidylyltransferase family)
MKSVCIIQARLASKRLPAKTMLLLPTGRTVLQEVVHRCLQIQGLDQVVVAMPASEGTGMLADTVRGACEVHFVGGFESDLVQRYAKCAQMTNASIIMRITADCPLLNPQVCSDMLAMFKTRQADKGGVDYMSNSWPVRNFPQGWDCEIFRRDALDAIAAWPELTADEREHLGPAFQNRQWVFNCMAYKAMQDQGSWKQWSINTFQDYLNVCKVLSADDASLERDRQAAE